MHRPLRQPAARPVLPVLQILHIGPQRFRLAGLRNVCRSACYTGCTVSRVVLKFVGVSFLLTAAAAKEGRQGGARVQALLRWPRCRSSARPGRGRKSQGALRRSYRRCFAALRQHAGCLMTSEIVPRTMKGTESVAIT